jgi:CBS domain-containing protein
MPINQFIEEAFKCDESETFAKAVSGAKTNDKDVRIIVTSGKKYAGVIDDRSIRDFAGNPETTKLSNVLSKSVPVAYANITEEEVVEKFLNSHAKIIPVLDKDEKPIGVITRFSGLKMLKNSSAVKGKKVSDYMTKPVVRISETEAIAMAKKLMKNHKIFHLPIVDEKDQLVGILSTYDLATKVEAVNEKAMRGSNFYPTTELHLESEPVMSIMQSNVETIKEDASIIEAMEKMLAKKVTSLVVEKNEKPVGILTTRDIFSTCLVTKPENVMISGLEKDEMPLKESILDQSIVFLQKIKRKAVLAPEDTLKIHFKSTKEGQKRRYEIKSNMTIAGILFSGDSNQRKDEHKNVWDPYTALKESLDELETIIYNDKMFRPRRDLPKKWYLDTEDEAQAQTEIAIKEGKMDITGFEKKTKNRKVSKGGERLG